MQAGETYDARKQMPGWDRSDFDESNWSAVNVGSALQATPLIQAYPGVSVRKTQELPALTLNEPQPAAYLVERVEAKGTHLSVGFLGVNILLPALTEIGRSDLAYRLIQNKTYPSWGYSIEQGATTIWERWNRYTKKDGFGPVKMNSFNHYAYGSCSEWMFRSMLGIDTDGAGFKKIKMKPEFPALSEVEGDQSVPWAKGHYDSIHGRIRSDWKWGDATFRWAITVPPNTTATAYMPEYAASLSESGTPIKKANGVKFLRTEKGRSVYELQSGSYAFAANMN